MPQTVLLAWVAVVAGSAGLSAALILLLRPLLVRHMLAHPNARSSHRAATPQGAGIAVMLAVLIVCIAALLLGGVPKQPSLVPILTASAFLTLVGALDDAHALSATWRFAGQTFAALAIVLSLSADVRVLPDLLPPGVEGALLVLGVVWFVNAVNFLDGLDWMMVAQVVPMTLGVAALQSLGLVPASIGLLALALLGATLGFAIFNKHPASVFLGDAGSLPMGLCLAFMLIYAAEAHFVSGLLLGLYTLADATVTLLRRMAAREPILAAHKSHFYQRAVAQGFSVPQVTARVFLLGLGLACLAIAAALLRSLAADIVLFSFGVIATGFVLFSFARGR